MIIEYFVPDYGQDAEDAYSFDFKGVVIKKCENWIAEAAAEDLFSNHDGWDSHWPLDITIILYGGNKTYTVELDSQPVFCATENNDDKP